MKSPPLACCVVTGSGGASAVVTSEEAAPRLEGPPALATGRPQAESAERPTGRCGGGGPASWERRPGAGHIQTWLLPIIGLWRLLYDDRHESLGRAHPEQVPLPARAAVSQVALSEPLSQGPA